MLDTSPVRTGEASGCGWLLEGTAARLCRGWWHPANKHMVIEEPHCAADGEYGHPDVCTCVVGDPLRSAYGGPPPPEEHYA